MRLNSKVLAVLVTTIMFGGIFLTSALGLWQTESTKEAAVYTTGEFAGQANPADIRGSYTFGDVEKNFNISSAVLVEAFAVETDDAPAFQVKSLEEIYADSPQEIGTASVRLFVAFYLGVPFDLSSDIYIPLAGANLLKERSLNAEQLAYLEAHTVVMSSTPPAENIVPTEPAAAAETAPDNTPTAEVTHEESTAEIVKGKTTFADLLAWGLTDTTIESIIGTKMPAAPGMTVKDFCTQNSLDFETIKPALQIEIDKLK